MAKTKEIDETSKKLQELEKKYGLSGTISDDTYAVKTGSLTLDIATGIGGSALGKIIEIFGPESSGKSTLTLHQICEYQKEFLERRVALFDFEHSFDKKYAKSIGVDVDKLLIYQPDNQEQGYDLLLGLVENSLISLGIIDSQTAATPLKVIEGEMGDATMALQARNNSKFLSKIKGMLSKNKCSLIAVSQTRKDIGGYGDPSKPTGGEAWKFYSDMRWKVSKRLDKDNETNSTTVEVIKNKCEKPFGKAEFDIVWGKGISRDGEIYSLALKHEIFSKAGAWITVPDMEKPIQGEEKVIIFLNDNPEYKEKIEKLVMEKINKQ